MRSTFDFPVDIADLKPSPRPSLDRIIERIQSCIVDAKALQLKMPERILSIALLETHENKQRSADARSGREFWPRRNQAASRRVGQQAN
jgi:hypothetical protein